MKVIKGLAFFSFLVIVFGSCFDPPEFPDVPEIGFQNIAFKDVADNSKPDSLIITIAFKDGDGDLGFDPQDPSHFSFPYNDAIFFRTNSSGTLEPVNTDVGELTNSSGVVRFIDVFDVEDPSTGTLAFFSSRNTPPYNTLLPDYNCVNYVYREFIVPESDKALLGPNTEYTDTLASQGMNYYLVSDTLYLESNPNHYNIEVDFLVKNSAGGFDEFDWRKEYCSTFDGRFPILSDKKSALDGTLKYSMESRGFKILFGNKTLKLRVQIKDRKLNLSNVIETDEFTLASILVTK